MIEDSGQEFRQAAGRHLLAELRRADPEAARAEIRRRLAAVRQHLQIG
jgi:hypothetical protein